MKMSESLEPTPAASAAPAPRKTIGIFTPCYNEELGIAECYERVREVMETKVPKYDYVHLFIDNCSQDRTTAILKEIAARDKRVKIIINSRNFGLSRSPHYGMLHTEGDALIPILADLQTPPHLIPEFIAKWEQGYKMVIAIRTGMKEGFLLRHTRNAFYRIIARVSKIEQIKDFIGFGLFDRQIVDIMRDLGEPDPYFRGLVSEIGFEKAFVEYHQPPRKHGKSKHTFFDLFDLALLALTTYSKAPLQIMTLVGFIIAALSLLTGFGYLILKLIFWNYFPVGIVPLLIATFFLAAVQLIALGLIGEYVGLVLSYARHFPLVIEKERVNFD
jgi:glycosyltransferase involved in cell wall biosynthesis